MRQILDNFGKFCLKKRARRGTLASFTGLPHPQGDFRPFAGLIPKEGIEVTDFGYLCEGAHSRFELEKVPDCGPLGLLKLVVQFTSYDVALTPRFYFDCGRGKGGEEHQLPIRESGRAYTTIKVPEGLRSVSFYPTSEPCIFALHRFQVEPCSVNELAQLDAQGRDCLFDVICYPVIDWSYRFQRPQQLLTRFAEKGHRVFYLAPYFSGFGKREVLENRLGENIFELVLPGNSRLNIYKDALSENTIQCAKGALLEYLSKHDSHQTLQVLDLPFWYPLAKRLREQLGWRIVYDCMDDHAGFENNEQAMLALEEEVIRQSDLLVVSSGVLYEKTKSCQKNTVLVRNAGEFEHFAKASLPESTSEFAYKKPVIGYYGAIAEWLDVSALELAAKRHPEWSFVLIGDVSDAKVKVLDDFRNVHFLGEKSYQELPAYLSSFDVCVIPFLRNRLTEATNPVKLYEYFAAKKPVVARRLPETEHFSSCAWLYDSAEEFCSSLEQAVQDDDPVRMAKREEIARENTWQHRFEQLRAATSKLYPKASIIVVSYESLEVLRECVSSIFSNTYYPNYELIIVDNASSLPVRAYLQALGAASPRVKLIQNEENKGFAAANNQGLALAADAEYFVLLNNDTVCPPGWLSRLLHYASKPDVGAVGPVTNSIGNEAQIAVSYADPKQMYPFVQQLMHDYLGECFDIPVLAMFCMAMRREVFEKVGFLDERFKVGMFEDDDYAKRVRQASLRVVCAEDVFVHHYGSVSFSKLSSEKYKGIFEENRRLFEEKWGAWVPHKYR